MRPDIQSTYQPAQRYNFMADRRPNPALAQGFAIFELYAVGLMHP